MLRFQGELERLPVPALTETCELYLRLVSPLLTETELATTRLAVAEFVRAGGQGELLQQRLLGWSERPGLENWLEPFWDDWYLCDDTPLVVNVSPGFALGGAKRPAAARAARLLAAAARFKTLIDREQLEPDVENGAPRCMREYSKVLGSTRIPGATRDSLELHPESRHVVVMRDNQLYSLEVLDGEGRIHSVEDLERALHQIVDDGETSGPPVGVLTTDRRRAWSHVREQHLRRGTPATREALATVESAILLLVLESGPPPSHPGSSEAARLFLHGDARGRWFDKSIQLIVADNGVAGFCMEHAGFDGSTAQRFAEFLVENEDSPPPAATKHGSPTPRQLCFELTEPLAAEIDRCERSADALLEKTDLAVLELSELGKRDVVRHRLSPDGFVQMAFQLTYFTLTGETASTYESISTKRFLHGRTEAMRSVSPESVAFVQSLRGTHRRAEAAARLRTAIGAHVATVQRCQEGRGADRHLLGLRRMLQPDEPMPELFADRGYATLSRSVLSTSALPSSPHIELSCFGPVVDEGFGLSYSIDDHAVRCVVTSCHGLAGAFAEQLERSLLEMSAVLD